MNKAVTTRHFIVGLVLSIGAAAACGTAWSEENTDPTEKAAPALGSGAVVAESSRLAGDAKRTRFVVDVDRDVAFGVFTLAEPYRVVIDLPEAEFRFGKGEGATGRGLVNAYRYGLIGPGKSRIVLDTKGPVKIDKAFAG